MGSFSKNEPILRVFRWGSAAQELYSGGEGAHFWSAKVQMETCGRMRCAVGPRKGSG